MTPTLVAQALQGKVSPGVNQVQIAERKDVPERLPTPTAQAVVAVVPVGSENLGARLLALMTPSEALAVQVYRSVGSMARLPETCRSVMTPEECRTLLAGVALG
jgi:hypothetical protein